MRGIAFMLDTRLFTWGTREEYFYRLCRALKDQGVQPVLVYNRCSEGDITERLRGSGATVTDLTVSRLNSARGAYQYFREFADIIRTHDIDTVHIRFFAYYSALQWMARYLGIKRVVFTEAAGGILHATSLRQRLLQLRARIVTSPITRFIAISDFVQQRLINTGIPSEKIRLVYNGVDTAKFVPNPSSRESLAQKHGIRNDELIITTAGNLLPIKNTHIIIEACALLKRRGLPFRLLVAGQGYLCNELQELSRRRNIADQTIWLGFCPSPEILMQASDVFVLASVGEAFGNVLAEAMACEVPVIGSRCGGIVEVIEEGKSGLLAKPQDPVSFADAIEELAVDRNKRQEMGRRGRERVLGKFTVDRAVAQTLSIYEELLT